MNTVDQLVWALTVPHLLGICYAKLMVVTVILE